MNKWLEAFVLDIKGQEGKNKLSPQERATYSLVLGAIFMVLGVMCLFVPSPYSIASLIAAVICFAIGARKYQIYWNKRKNL